MNGKQCHTRAEAKGHAAALRRSRLTSWISVYRCPDADQHPEAMFHVGHTPRPKKRRRRGR